MKKSRGIAVLLLTAIVTVFFCYVAAVGIGLQEQVRLKISIPDLTLPAVSASHTRLRTAIRARKICPILSTRCSSVSLSTVLRHRHIRKVPIVSLLRFREYQTRMRYWKNLESQAPCISLIRQMQTETRTYNRKQ